MAKLTFNLDYQEGFMAYRDALVTATNALVHARQLAVAGNIVAIRQALDDAIATVKPVCDDDTYLILTLEGVGLDEEAGKIFDANR